MRRLAPLQAMRLITEDMRSEDRIGLCSQFLGEITNPGAYAALRDHAHMMARHADCLERQLKLAASRDGFCWPEGADPSGNFPRGGGDAAPRGLFSLIPGGGS